MKVVLEANDVDFFKRLVFNLDKEAGGQMAVGDNGVINIITISMGSDEGITPDFVERYKVAWHTHVCTGKCKDNRLPIPPSPNDMKTSLIMNCIGKTEIDFLFTTEGVYTYWPSSKLLNGCRSKNYHYFNDKYDDNEEMYLKTARNSKTPEQKRKIILNRYIKQGYSINFWKWSELKNGLVVIK